MVQRLELGHGPRSLPSSSGCWTRQTNLGFLPRRRSRQLVRHRSDLQGGDASIRTNTPTCRFSTMLGALLPPTANQTGTNLLFYDYTSTASRNRDPPQNTTIPLTRSLVEEALKHGGYDGPSSRHLGKLPGTDWTNKEPRKCVLLVAQDSRTSLTRYEIMEQGTISSAEMAAAAWR